MRNMFSRLVRLAILSLCAWMGCAASRDAEITLGDVPQQILNSVKTSYPKCKFISAEKRTVAKQLVHFAIEIKYQGREFDVYLDPQGNAFRTSSAITRQDVPAEVIKTIEKSYSGWSVKELYKELDLKTNAVIYSFDLQQGEQALEIDILPDGSVFKTLELRNDD